MDAVLSYHTNPWTCGIAKFNQILAERSGVPMRALLETDPAEFPHPLLSINLGEFSSEHVKDLDAWLRRRGPKAAYSVFLHSLVGSQEEAELVEKAARVYCGNAELVERLRTARPDAQELWCPGTILDTQPMEATELSVFSFGMAHKIRTGHYRKLAQLLEKTQKTYAVYVSTAVHSGTALDGSFTAAFDELKTVFGPKIHFLGYLSDNAVFQHLSKATYFAAFFDKGVRANNTSVNTAMQLGTVVVTNLDRHSPPQYAHGKNVFDIAQTTELPTSGAELERVRGSARDVASTHLGWDALIARLESLGEIRAAPRPLTVSKSKRAR